MVKVVVVDSADTQKQRTRRIRWWWLGLALLLMLALGAGAFVLWATTPDGELLPEALAAMTSDSHVTVTTNDWLAFIPNDAPPTAGLILYPGARIQPEAYAPLARQIAEAGYLAVIVYVPLNLATLNPSVASAVIENFSAIDTWVVGGHSRGGVAAAMFAADNPQSVDGLVLLASFPANDTLADTAMGTVSIYGTNDGLLNMSDVLAAESSLPPQTHFVAIAGGNHSQFGYYGLQSGDGEATISREEQIGQTVAEILDLLHSLQQ